MTVPLEEDTRAEKRQRRERCGHKPRTQGMLATPEARREAWDGLSRHGLWRKQPCPHLEFGLLAS